MKCPAKGCNFKSDAVIELADYVYKEHTEKRQI